VAFDRSDFIYEEETETIHHRRPVSSFRVFVTAVDRGERNSVNMFVTAVASFFVRRVGDFLFSERPPYGFRVIVTLADRTSLRRP